MARMGFLHALWLTRFSRPAGERVLHRHILRSRPRRILELGLGTLVRTERLLRAAGARGDAAPVHYVGLDRFESRNEGDPPGVTLKEAHRRLTRLGQVQLVPGNVDTSLARLSNHLGTFDLILISADNDDRHAERCWFFLQRLTLATSLAFVEDRRGSAGSTAWTAVSKPRIDELAAKAVMRRAG